MRSKNRTKWSLLFTLGLNLGFLPVYGETNPPALQMTVLDSLSFGAIKAGGINGSMTLSASAPTLVTTTGGVYAVHTSHASPRSATRLQLSGSPDTLVFISLPSGLVKMKKAGQADGLNLSLSLNQSLRTLGPTGVINDVFIGGTLSVGMNASAGQYRGDFAVRVDYQ